MNDDDWMKMRKNSWNAISHKHILVGLTSFDNSLQWKRPKDEVKLYDFCKW